MLCLGALFFVFASIPKQMKSFFFSGLFYVAVSVVWITNNHFIDTFAWPVALALAGLGLLGAAWRYPSLFDRAGPKAIEPGPKAEHTQKDDEDIA